MEASINELLQRRVVHGSRIPVIRSSDVGIEQRTLDGASGECRATAIVRVAAGVDLPPLTRQGGQEFLVLDGSVRDENGDYPAGYYVRNPPASTRAPRFAEGCTMLLKSWHFDPNDRTEVRLDTRSLPFRADRSRPGVHSQVLFLDSHEEVRIERWSAGVAVEIDAPAGLELFVLSGAMTESGDRLEAEAWLRLPPGCVLRARAAMEGCRVWMKAGSAIR